VRWKSQVCHGLVLALSHVFFTSCPHRDELMKNPHSSVSDKDRPRLLKTLLLGTLKIHAPDIYYARYADQDESQ
jgi:hypothetical protein